MNKLKSLHIATIVILLSSSAWAATDSENQAPSDMPMTNEEQNSMMMTPEMMEKMMASGQHQNMPMMNPHMMHMMMHGMSGMGHGHGNGHGQNCDMPMMKKGKEGMMMNPQMMQMRMQHMANMEQRLENIESLLSQLVELQRAE
jgi:hypothetical protein